MAGAGRMQRIGPGARWPAVKRETGMSAKKDDEALRQEQTGQVYPDKDVDQGVWSRKKGEKGAQDAPKHAGDEQDQPKAQVRPKGAGTPSQGEG